MFPLRLSAYCRLVGLLLVMAPVLLAQQTTVPGVKVPTLVNFSGSLADADGKPLTRITSIRFSLYPEQEGGEALWSETQNVSPEPSGHYSAMLGATTGQGLPADLFMSGAARWLGLEVEGSAEEPRIMLVSVPYALKAGDAQTIGGMPPSAFALAGSTAQPGGSNSVNVAANPKAANTPVAAISGTGKTGYLPEWLSSTTLGSSAFFQSSSGNLGISTTAPAQKFEVDLGNLLVKGTNNFQKTGNTATLYVGDTNHLIQSIYGSGIAIGVYKVPKAIFIQDTTGSVGIGTTSPSGSLEVLGKSTQSLVTVLQEGTGNGIQAYQDAGACNTEEPCAAVFAYGSNSSALIANNDNPEATISAYNNFGPGYVLYASGAAEGGGQGYCYVNTDGDLACSGSKSAVVTLENQHKVALYAVEAPENWFEDFGTGELAGGSAVISLDPKFTQTVNTTLDYHVFLTPRGDCKGLYFSQQSPTSFVVRELGGGTSNVQFDYRIVAHRKGYENIRLADLTDRINRLQRSNPGKVPVRQSGAAQPELYRK